MKRNNKYNAKKTIVDGITFDSKKEAHRYGELQFLEKAGVIADLQRQVKFEIVPKQNANKTARYYVADFVYVEKGSRVIEDVKSPATKNNSTYRLKKALVLAHYPAYTFREV